MAGEPTDDEREAIAKKLDEMCVSVTPDQLEELAIAFPALKSWMRLVEELAREKSN